MCLVSSCPNRVTPLISCSALTSQGGLLRPSLPLHSASFVCLSIRLCVQFVASKLSHRILEQARQQQDELQEEHGPGGTGEGAGFLKKKKKK